VPQDANSRFRSLPEPVRPEDMVESVDVSQVPTSDEETQARERFIRYGVGA
jgi:hypothetical protein